MVASVPKWIAEMKGELGTYEYLAPVVEMEEVIKEVTLENLLDMEAVIAGDPDDVIELCKAYESTGADLLLCLVNPYKISARVGRADDRAHGQARDPRVPAWLTRSRAASPAAACS